MALTTFSPNTLIKSSEVNANFQGLADGTNDTTNNSLQTYRDEDVFDHVISGGVWSGDSYAVNRNASMTAIVVLINGRRIAISAVVARTFTASKDTYIDVLDNLDGTGTLVYTEVANNAASPALASNSIRIGIIVTGATTIAAVGSVNQGEQDKVLPIASSIPYQVTDSLGNLICSRDPQRRILGYRQRITNMTTITAANTQIPELSCPVIVPTGRKVRVTVFLKNMQHGTAVSNVTLSIWEGTPGSGTQIGGSFNTIPGSNYSMPGHADALWTPSSASKTYNGAFGSGANGAFEAAAAFPAFIKVELA